MLWNPAREVTEAITANIVVELDGRRVTPPVGCGLLPGTMRADLLARGEIFEARVTVDELVQAPRFWLINSVRGWQRRRSRSADADAESARPESESTSWRGRGSGSGLLFGSPRLAAGRHDSDGRSAVRAENI